MHGFPNGRGGSVTIRRNSGKAKTMSAKTVFHVIKYSPVSFLMAASFSHAQIELLFV